MACSTGRTMSREGPRSGRGQENISASISQPATAPTATSAEAAAVGSARRRRPDLAVRRKWSCWIWVPSEANCQENKDRRVSQASRKQIVTESQFFAAYGYFLCLMSPTDVSTRRVPVGFSMIRYFDTTIIYILVQRVTSFSRNLVYPTGTVPWGAPLCSQNTTKYQSKTGLMCPT